MTHVYRYLNLGILAHVDAGKTSLTERLLYEAGVIEAVGSIRRGTTQTDSLALERRRGITIRSAVVSFAVDDLVVNLIDTPGHSDFIAEVERVLQVLDGVVLVVSSVEGVQAQTRVLVRALERLRMPILFFVNKIDRAGADPARVVAEIEELVTGSVLPLGTVSDAGSRSARYNPYEPSDAALADATLAALAEHDDRLLQDWVDDKAGLLPGQVRSKLATQVRRNHVRPVLFGSAMTGAGVADLIGEVTTFLVPGRCPAGGPAQGVVFKVDRGTDGEKLAYTRLFAGAVSLRDRVELPAGGAKVTGIDVFGDGRTHRADRLESGQIGVLHGLATVRVGDPIGPAGGESRRSFSPPTLETVVDPASPAERSTLWSALSRLAEQDPLIDVRQDDVRGEISVSLYGEVQKEVIAAMLADDHGVAARFRQTSTICVERPVGTGSDVELIAADTNPYLATVGLRVQPGPPGSGTTVALEVEPGSMPPAFFTAVRQAVADTLEQGLRGWRVVDCVVTMTHSGYWARQSHSHGSFDLSMSSTAGDFRKLTPLVLMSALQQAGTRVEEPIHRFELDTPAEALSGVLTLLSRHQGVAYETQPHRERYTLVGRLPAASVHRLRAALPGQTAGEGTLVTDFDGYQPVRGAAPRRRRVGVDPLDRREYLLRVTR